MLREEKKCLYPRLFRLTYTCLSQNFTKQFKWALIELSGNPGKALPPRRETLSGIEVRKSSLVLTVYRREAKYFWHFFLAF